MCVFNTGGLCRRDRQKEKMDMPASTSASTSKGSNFTLAETHALLEGVRANYANIMAKLSTSVTAKMKHNIWTDITKSVNATGQ